ERLVSARLYFCAEKEGFMMRKILSVVLLIFVLGFALSGCGAGKSDAADDGKLNVVATIFPEYDFARAISGGAANVSMLIDPGAGVHSFEPAPSDIKTIQKADVFIFVGGESDEWAVDLLDSIDTSAMKIVRLIDYVNVVPEELKEGMTPEEEEAAEGGEAAEGEEEYDEHVWVSPKNALLLIDAIRDAMCEADPANAELYSENGASYKAELEAVDRDIAAVVSSAKRDKIVVADKFPFRYFVDDYGLEYAAAFPGCSDQADAGAATIAYLINTVQNEDIPYVYYVELSNQSVAESISEQTGAGMLLLNSCENITKDDFESGITYVDLMKANALNLEKGLN
ncbi:MAG: metal ABC transporter substrate-binding protein, partial [Clostridiales Family XIII bacterium]|nr:metal ABC transporter substrate-binding protein [Clostridiales Family XIII bacterium]